MLTRHNDESQAIEDSADGRHSLRLVKLRLALTLIAVAVLPLAAISPVIRTIVDDPRIAQHERLAAQAEHAAVEIRRELDETRVVVSGAAASAAMATAFRAKPTQAQLAGATAGLAAVLSTPSGLITGVALVDPSGAVRLHVGAASAKSTGAALAPPEQPQYRVIPSGSDLPSSVEVIVAVPAGSGGSAAGSMVASMPLDGLLRWSSVGLGDAQDLALIDDAGNSLAVISSTADVGGAPSPIAIEGSGGALATSSMTVELPGLGPWQVVSSAPLIVASVPLPALAVLMVLLVLLGSFAWWMGRKILEPASELEAQRARFEGLYHTAREAALQDNLTGLGNHRAFQEALAQTVEQARRYGTKFALILLDVDEFKRVNDTRGHAVGDELLAEVGELIRATIRATDWGYRIGGDEFAVLLTETGSAGAAITARRILSRGLDERGAGRYKGAISFSAGVTACPEFGTTRVELTAQADAALYRGKRSGRTVVSVFDPNQDRGHVDDGMRSELSASVAAVIEAGTLTAVFQPIVQLATGKILAYEGLVRVDPSSGFPHTGALFDAAEAAGRVLDLDRAALEVVLRGSNAIPADSLVSLNVSPRSFEAPEFNATVFLAILRRHGVDPGRVLLELTERDVIRDADRLREIVQSLQAAGVRVAADDVGAGNAGLRLLSQFRFDVVKIDLSLVQGGAGQDQTLSVLTSLVGLARRWGALTIAEGVETPAQLAMIRQLDIDAGQGYLLGRPGGITPVTSVDLDQLASGEAVAVEPAPPPPIQRRATFEVARAPALVGALATTPVPTAASVIAGHGPSLFN